ncbi:MAG: alpha/beta hydrolase [Lachnospiraceae bacterium]|nr:alpha/beta hydrolase [Lachnospiraceae bacterium]
MKLQGKTYTTCYGDIHYWVRCIDQKSPWLVMLPGLTADHQLFDKQIEGLRDRYNIFTWDAPAHGLSRPFELKFSMWEMAEYLHNIFEIEGISRPVLIGQSLGGYISQVYMEMYPDSMAGFISIDSCPLKRKYYTNWEIALLKHTKWMYFSIPWKLLLWLGKIGTAQSEYGRNLIKETWSVYKKKEYCELADYGYRILAEAVEAEREYDIMCPVLLICGEKDAAGSARSYNRKWEKQDGHKLVWLKNAGHNSNTDAPEEVNQLIDEFASELFKC